MIHQRHLQYGTRGRGTYEITSAVRDAVRASGVRTGLCHVFVQHTSASLILCENADPSVRRDLEAAMVRLAPDGDPANVHDAEGPDDMPAHLRTVLTASAVSVPVGGGDLLLGAWQGIYLWEHRVRGHMRTIVVTIVGDADAAS